MKTIVRYLHCTADKGTIVTPTGDLSLDCYVDADFPGLHGRDPDHFDTRAKSCTGYIITLGGCPILWRSQLQPEIYLSTLESENSALSASMRTLLPLCDLLGEICKELTLPPDFKSTIAASLETTTVHCSLQPSNALPTVPSISWLSGTSSGTMFATETSKYLRSPPQIS
jgi:hypothetical protein